MCKVIRVPPTEEDDRCESKIIIDKNDVNQIYDIVINKKIGG